MFFIWIEEDVISELRPTPSLARYNELIAKNSKKGYTRKKQSLPCHSSTPLIVSESLS
jgi:hypothetical protein